MTTQTRRHLRTCRQAGWMTAMLQVTLAVAAIAAASNPSGDASAPPDSAVIEVFNRPICVLRVSYGGWSPHDRVAQAQRRIEGMLGEHRPGEVTTRETPQGFLVEVGNRGVFMVMPGDADSLAGETPQRVATRAAGRLHAAITAALEQRRPERILRAVVLSLLGTVLFVLGIYLLRRSYGSLKLKVQSQQNRARHKLKVGNVEVFDVTQFEHLTGRAVGILIWILGILLLDLWLTWVLGRFPYTQPWADALGGWFLGTLRRLGAGFLGTIPGLFTVVLIFFLARLVIRALSSFFVAVQTRRITVSWLHPDVALPTQRIATTLLWLFAVMVAYPYLPGSGSGVFKGISLFVGIVLSLGSSALVQQAMSGFVLMYSRSFRQGEYVRVGETEGTIRELGMLSTKIETNKREMVAIPNAVMIGAQIKNYSRLASEGQPMLLSTAVTIGYDAPWRQVHAMLKEAAGRTAGLLREPAPRVLQTALSDFYVEYMLLVPIAEPRQRIPTLAELHTHIQDAFNENSVQIMSPHFEGQPEGKVWSPPVEWNPPLARTRGQSPES